MIEAADTSQFITNLLKSDLKSVNLSADGHSFRENKHHD